MDAYRTPALIEELPAATVDDRRLEGTLAVLVVLGLGRLVLAAAANETIGDESAFGLLSALACMAALAALRVTPWVRVPGSPASR
jgi:hypothetical protein